jgi:hypothetical protein
MKENHQLLALNMLFGYQKQMTIYQADTQCIFSGESLRKQIVKANCILCVECCCIAEFCETKDQGEQTLDDPLLKKDSYQEIEVFMYVLCHRHFE